MLSANDITLRIHPWRPPPRELEHFWAHYIQTVRHSLSLTIELLHCIRSLSILTQHVQSKASTLITLLKRSFTSYFSASLHFLSMPSCKVCWTHSHILNAGACQSSSRNSSTVCLIKLSVPFSKLTFSCRLKWYPSLSFKSPATFQRIFFSNVAEEMKTPVECPRMSALFCCTFLYHRDICSK